MIGADDDGVEDRHDPSTTAYLLKEQLRQIYHLPGRKELALSDAWLKWARRCQLEPFVKLAATDHRATLQDRGRADPRTVNARVEQINTQLRLIMRHGFGFRSTDAVISLAMLSLGGLRPPRPSAANQLV